jgi:hypothetical protein
MENSPTQDDPLDWSIYVRRSEWPTSAKLFLAEAVNRAGAALWDLWDPNLPAWLAHPKVPQLKDADEAFDEDGPIPEIHAQFGKYVRKIMPVAVYRANFEEEVPPSIILSWELKQEGEICRTHWDEAVQLSYGQAGEREFAQTVIVDVAKLIGELAVSGRMRTYARPLNGGVPQLIEPDLWEIDPRIRIATCALNLAEPFVTDLPPSHLIFVEEEDLERELASLPAERKIQPIRALVGGRSAAEDSAIVKEMADWLNAMMDKPPDGTPWPYEHWKRPRFFNAAVDHFGERYHERNFNRAYAIAQAKHPGFPRRGAPRKFID